MIPKLLLVVSTLIALHGYSAAEDAARMPNVVVFIADDHGMLDSEPYGATDVRTPNLSKFATVGTKFTHAYVASPSCGPSRTAMLTGLWPARNGAEANHQPRRDDIPGLPITLHNLGYEVAAIGKVAHNNWAPTYKFDVIAGPSIGCTETKEVASFLAKRNSQKPLFLFYGTHFPHTPWLANNGYDPKRVNLPPTFVDTSETREQRTKYYSSITAADKLLGELRELTEKYVKGDTIFIYMADNGAAWPFAKWDLYDASTRIPFIISWPGHLAPGTVNDAMICTPDLLPTCIELAGGKVPAGLDGESFAGLLTGTSTTHRDRIFNTATGDGDMNVYPCRSVTDGKMKFILNLHPEFQHHTHISRSATAVNGQSFWRSWVDDAIRNPLSAAVVKRYTERPAEELYDLSKDPYEQHNLAANPEYQPQITAMRNDLRKWMTEQGDKETVMGKPLLIGQPVTLLGGGKKKGKDQESEKGKDQESEN